MCRNRPHPTPCLLHGWNAGMLFEETQRTMFCWDLFYQVGDVEPSTECGVIGRFRDALTQYQSSPLGNYLPYTSITERLLKESAEHNPKTLAAMHGSTFVGDGKKALLDFEWVLKVVLGS